MDHPEILIHVADRIGLRPFCHSDAADLAAGLNDWQVARWLARVPHPYRIDHAKAYLSRQEHRNYGAALPDADAVLALALCHDGQVIGGMSLVPSSRRQGARELGFWLSGRFWGQGIMPLAVQALIDEVMRHAPSTLIVASANHDNFRSQRAIHGLGFVEDGQDEIFSTPLQKAVTTICFRLP